MAADFGPRGIRVNAISPGEIDTAILSPGTDKIVEEQIPLRRLGEPEEVAKAIYFLCTEQSSYVNGAELHINGGQRASNTRHPGSRDHRSRVSETCPHAYRRSSPILHHEGEGQPRLMSSRCSSPGSIDPACSGIR